MKRRDMTRHPRGCVEVTCPTCAGTGRVPGDYPIPESVLPDRRCARCVGFRTIVTRPEQEVTS